MSVQVTNTTASLSGKTLAKLEDPQTFTGQKTFDLGASAPFVCVSGAAKVTYLDADKLDGEEGTAYHNASNLSSGTVPDARFPATLPAASGVNLTALNASNLASGTVPIGRLGVSGPAMCQGRLTLSSGVPVPSSDVTAATTIYFTPYQGNIVGLYTAAAWELKTFSEISIAVPATTNQMYDVFVYNSAGTVTLEVVAWTNDTTRATALALQDGVYCKTGALDRRYLGSFRTTSVSGQTEDSVQNRLLWNNYHRRRRELKRRESTVSWTYTTATFRQANNSASNQITAVVGLTESVIMLSLSVAAGNTVANVLVQAGIGEDSTTAVSVEQIGGFNHTDDVSITAQAFTAQLIKPVPLGYHYYAWLEYSTATGTTTWHGVNGTSNSGMIGSIEN